MNNRAAELAERLRKNFTGPMTDEEVTFLRDVQAFIEFAIRNGLSFSLVASALLHDVKELVLDGFDLQQAKARSFLPKVTGYSKIVEEDFGGAEEPLE